MTADHVSPFGRDAAADLLFDRDVPVDDVPDDVRAIAPIVRSAQRPGTADELIGDEAIIAQLTETIQRRGRTSRRMLVRPSVRSVAAALGMVVVLSGTAAALTGELPQPLPRVQVRHSHHAVVAPKSAAATNVPPATLRAVSPAAATPPGSSSHPSADVSAPVASAATANAPAGAGDTGRSAQVAFAARPGAAAATHVAASTPTTVKDAGHGNSAAAHAKSHNGQGPPVTTPDRGHKGSPPGR